jgi:phage repressor protein C with HTH and peptisase S24 domain
LEGRSIKRDTVVLPLQRVRVIGPSMVPTLRHGDTVIVRHGARVRAGDLVLATFRTLPDRLVLKRAVRVADSGWWLASDNGLAGGDSATHGVADVHGRVVLRISRGLPRPVRRHPTHPA